jgi:peptidylprolyl isomerase
MNAKAPLAALTAAAIGLGVAGCGSSAAPGITLAPSGGATTEKVTSTATTSTTSTTSTTATTATVNTPTSGPLSKEPVIKVPSGAPPTHLVTKDLIVGTGATAAKGSSVVVNYVGALYKNGKVFDASWNRHETFGPFTLGEGAVIKGWDEGLVGMRVGGRRELIIPPALAYGAAGSPPTIPANATLIFVVDLLSSK